MSTLHPWWGSRAALRHSDLADHRPGRPRGGSRVRLRDGAPVAIRPVRGTDAPLIADLFARLSLHSRRMRFLTARSRLSAAELHHLTNVDHRDHEALLALSGDGRGIGVARYIRDPQDRHAAELAVTIADDWQGRGLGTELLARMSDRARQEGLHRLTALVAAENGAMIGLLRSARARLTSRGNGVAEYEIGLVPADGHGLESWLRAFEEASLVLWR
jgi:RimJ/RimL family protein N-acetyltransferase